MKRAPLRVRVALGYGLTGFLLSLAFAATLLFIAEKYESIFVTALLDSEADAYFGRLADDPRAALPRSPGFSIYRRAEAPEAMRALAPGEHELDLPQQPDIHVAVYQRGDEVLVAVLDMGEIEAIEQFLAWMMLAVVAGGTIVSAWLGWALAAATIRPVERLAGAVDAMAATPARTNLANGYGPDGVGRLASAIDAYQGRLADSGERERAFFANASHELRTPIAVIRSTVEVLRDDPNSSEYLQARLQRIERSTLELAVLLDAVLLSARGTPKEFEPIDLQAMCWQAQEAVAGAHPEAARRIVVIGEGPSALSAPRTWVACILGVLFQRIAGASAQAQWQVRLDEGGLTIGQAADELAGSHEIHRSDLGIGLVFAQRLCEALGWRLEQEVSPAHGLRIRLDTRAA